MKQKKEEASIVHSFLFFFLFRVMGWCEVALLYGIKIPATAAELFREYMEEVRTDEQEKRDKEDNIHWGRFGYNDDMGCLFLYCSIVQSPHPILVTSETFAQRPEPKNPERWATIKKMFALGESEWYAAPVWM